jgi:hypothetical protein
LFKKFFPFRTLLDFVIAIAALTELYQACSWGQQVTKKYKENNLPCPAALQYAEYFFVRVGLHKAFGHGKEPLLRGTSHYGRRLSRQGILAI